MPLIVPNSAIESWSTALEGGFRIVVLLQLVQIITEPCCLASSFADRLMSLGDFNTRVVLMGTMLLGTSAGVVGTFMLLRRQSLVGDVVSHAALPGVAFAFLIGELVAPGSGRSLGRLLIGASAAGLLAVGAMSLIRRWSQIKPDAALATVLGVFFGGGAVLLKAVQEIPSGNQAGLQHFILGSAATMTTSDVWLIMKVSLVIVVLVFVLFKELALLSFDDDFARTQGWPVGVLDAALLCLVVAVTVTGLQSVGVLMVALMIAPPTAARFWTEKLSSMTLLAALFGASSAAIGTVASAMFPQLAGGPTIVLMGSLIFVVSLFFGKERGLWQRWWNQRDLHRRIGRHDLLRACYEVVESLSATPDALSVEQLTGCAVRFLDLQSKRAWSVRRLQQLISQNVHAGILRDDVSDGWRLTQAGAIEAQRVVRNHRLWEFYLIEYADFGAAHVDRVVDDIEHVIDPEVLIQLEQSVKSRSAGSLVPPSPHE